MVEHDFVNLHSFFPPLSCNTHCSFTQAVTCAIFLNAPPLTIPSMALSFFSVPKLSIRSFPVSVSLVLLRKPKKSWNFSSSSLNGILSVSQTLPQMVELFIYLFVSIFFYGLGSGLIASDLSVFFPSFRYVFSLSAGLSIRSFSSLKQKKNCSFFSHWKYNV